MPLKILILEDNKDRQAAMRASLQDRLYTFEARFFEDVAVMVRALGELLPETVAISLDHDLELQPDAGGRLHDPGTGREVADYLARQRPSCPVIIHTSNHLAAAGMERVLKEAGWTTYRVTPYGDLEWVSSHWLRTLRRAVLTATAQPPVPSVGAPVPPGPLERQP